MGMLDTVQTGRRRIPPRMLIHAEAGNGKTTIGSQAPSPIFMFFEDSQGELDLPRFEPGGPGKVKFTEWSQVVAAVNELINDPHDRQMLVIDTIDEFEPILIKEIARKNNVEDIETIGGGFGKGMKQVKALLRQFLSYLDTLCEHRGMGILLLGHTTVRTFEDGDAGSHSCYDLDMDKQLAPIVTNWCETVLFGTTHKVTTEEKGAFGKKTTKVISQGRRIMRTERRPSQIAKNRARMPYELVMPTPAPRELPVGCWDVINDALYPKTPETQTPAK